MESLALTLQLVGGLLLGAALVSVVIFFAPEGLAQPLGALVVAGAALAAARLVEERDAGASESILAVGLVAAASIPFYETPPAWLGYAAAATCAIAAFTRVRRSPLAIAAVVAFAIDLHHATGVDLFAATHDASVWTLYAGVAAYGALLLAQRASPWARGALAVHAPLLTLALLPVLDHAGVRDAGIAALAVGTQLAVLLAVGVRLDVRPLVASASALLSLAALTFAFLALGPALSAIILLLLGALLVWRAEALRGYFGRRVPPQLSADEPVGAR